MEINITSMKILTQFFKSPTRKFYPRELSRILRINHVTITQHLKKLDKLGLLHSEESNLAKTYSIVISRESQNLKLYYNLEKIRTSGIIDDLQKGYDFPVIIVFGSYAKSSR